MRTSEDWYIGSVFPSRTDLTVEKMRENGVKVVNFRQQEQVSLRGGRTAVDIRPMFPGYIFLRGRPALEIKSLPFAPNLLRSDDDFRVARAKDIQILLDEFGGSLLTLGRRKALERNRERTAASLEAAEMVRKTLSQKFRVLETADLQA
jgi:hypothetical protein